MSRFWTSSFQASHRILSSAKVLAAKSMGLRQALAAHIEVDPQYSILWTVWNLCVLVYSAKEVDVDPKMLRIDFFVQMKAR
ncbi:hypothetical protein CVT25_004641 [Psilocybe cyanescens]|uniref:Uncharacterized protein n=1 Tax=Psilocybe cyanescens TaxID=93625 RepID=A0A409VT35_PSICY|nr:hypothetical protein CVT25_004641 [Psilocybe cyanescens]